jgi:hypothetical protein
MKKITVKSSSLTRQRFKKSNYNETIEIIKIKKKDNPSKFNP